MVSIGVSFVGGLLHSMQLWHCQYDLVHNLGHMKRTLVDEHNVTILSKRYNTILDFVLHGERLRVRVLIAIAKVLPNPEGCQHIEQVISDF